MKRHRVGLLLLVLLPSCGQLGATSEVFVLARDGSVWVASDTLLDHVDFSGNITTHSTCKLQFSKARILFNAGHFRDFEALYRDESALPVEAPDITLDRMARIMAHNRAERPPNTPGNSIFSEESGGFVEIFKGSVWGGKISVATDIVHEYVGAFPLFPGIPHGIGQLFLDNERKRARTDAAFAQQIARDPARELLTILEGEALDPANAVGPPFTLVELHADGLISDHSDNEVCVVPVDLRER